MGALKDWREAAGLPRGVAPGATGLPWTVGRLVSIDTDANRAVVSVLGSQPVALPYLAGDYEGITTVFVQLDPLRTGAGQIVLGPAGAPAEPPPIPPPPTGTVTTTALIMPTWSGTWRVDRAAWDRWNVDRYGGRSDLYQGDDYGSGTLVGLATYGTQVQDLGATGITAATVSVIRSNNDGTPVLQGAPHGSKPAGAPTPSGATVSGLGSVDLLPSGIAEGMRVGAVRSLAAVGPDYGAIRGTSHPLGMALSITYTRPA